MSEIHVGDIGTQFIVTIQDYNGTAEDISAATTKQIILKAPDGTRLAKNAGFVTDGSDGQIVYTTVSGDMSTNGTWKIQGYVITPSGQWHTEFESFRVVRNL